MEIIYEEDSKSSSSEDSDRLEQKDDKETAGRSYECVFCKRGFTTAQALGGHMNIHRKDKGKLSRPNISSAPNNSVDSRGGDENYGSLKSYLPFQIYPKAPEIVPVIYQIPNFSASTWDLRLQPHTVHHGDDHELSVQYPRHLDLLDEDWKTSLRLQVGPTHHHVDHHDREGGKIRSEVGSEQGDLDLELRLGHYP